MVLRVFTSPFLQNKFVLYGSLLLVLLNIIRHISNQNINAVVLMALIGLVMSYFSKNMIIVLLTAVISVFLLEMLGSQGVMEGMKTKEGAKNKEDNDGDSVADEKDEPYENEKKESSENKVKEKNTLMNEKKEEKVKTDKVNDDKKKQGMTKLNPAKYNEEVDADDDDDNAGDSGSAKGKTANRIDYASTLEQAYDNIENIIGEDGVRGLTDQTKSLMNQQKELMNNMKDMGPLLKSAEGFMKQITGNGGIGGITEMLKGFATPAAKK